MAPHGAWVFQHCFPVVGYRHHRQALLALPTGGRHLARALLALGWIRGRPEFYDLAAQSLSESPVKVYWGKRMVSRRFVRVLYMET